MGALMGMKWVIENNYKYFILSGFSVHKKLSDAAYELLLAHPTLIKRPIVTTDARPDELQIGFQEDELHAFLRLP